MALVAPRVAPGVSAAMARVASRFYLAGILLVAATILLPHKTEQGTRWLILIAFLAAGMIAFLVLFSWDKYLPRVFTITNLLSSCFLTAALVYFTGGIQSSYQMLFFLIILFSYFSSRAEMFVAAFVVTLFYLFPYVYERPDSYQFATSAVMVVLFFLGVYILSGLTKIVLSKNEILEELNARCLSLSSLTAELLHDVGAGSVLDSFAESLEKHLPSTYCLVMLLDGNRNLITRIACPQRGLAWKPLIGAVYSLEQLALTRTVLESRQPLFFRLEIDRIDEALRTLLPNQTCSVLVVPIVIGDETGGIIIFGEERAWARAPFTNDKIRLAEAVSKQLAAAIGMRRCHESLTEAKRLLQISYDKSIKAERLAALGEVTHALEHEINNPLSVIVNWSEVYRGDESIDQEIRKKFQIMYDMAIRIMDVIRKLSSIRDTKSVEFMKGQRMTDLE